MPLCSHEPEALEQLFGFSAARNLADGQAVHGEPGAFHGFAVAGADAPQVQSTPSSA